MSRNMAIELARVTEAAALAASLHAGNGDKEMVDQAAVDAMRRTLQEIDELEGLVVIGEGEKDAAPMLYNGEVIGSGPLKFDIAVDPIDGTTLMSKGLAGAIAVIAMSTRGSMNVPVEVFYMDKIAVGPAAKDAIDINLSKTENLQRIAKALGKPINEVTVVVLDRPRHAELLQEIRDAGARVKLISDGDVAAGIQASLPGSEIDVLMGIGGTPEGVIVAAAMRCTGGAIQCKPWPRDDAEREKCIAMGSLDKVYTTEDLCGGEDVYFSATGATTGEMLKGVNVRAEGASTHTVVMSSHSGTIRWIESTHNFTRLDKMPPK